MKTYFILEPEVIIRKTMNKFLLIKPTIDYSKKKIPEITPFAAEVLEYIKVARSFDEIKAFYNLDENDAAQLERFLNYLGTDSYVKTWKIGDDPKENFISDLLRKEWYNEGVPFGATIELSPKCNFSCVHCYLSHHREEKTELTTDQIKKELDILKEIGVFYIFFSGGEPFLRKDFAEIYSYAKEQGFIVTIFTNGYLLTPELLGVFKKYPPIEVDISLYGGSDETYKKVTGVDHAFSRIKNNIQLLKQNGIFVSLKSPIMTLTQNDLPAMVDFAQQNELPFRMSFEIHQTIDGEERSEYKVDLKTAVELYKKYSYAYQNDIMMYKKYHDKTAQIARKRYACGTGKTGCFIDYNGNIFPCIHTRHRGQNIFSKNIQELWKDIRDISYECLQDNEDYKCLHCNATFLCKSCPALRENVYGSPLIVKDIDCVWAHEILKNLRKEVL